MPGWSRLDHPTVNAESVQSDKESQNHLSPPLHGARKKSSNADTFFTATSNTSSFLTAPEHEYNNSVFTTVVLLLADDLGTGILILPYLMIRLGPLKAVICHVFSSLLCIYTGTLLQEIYLKDQSRNTYSIFLSDLLPFGGEAMVYTNNFFVMSNYMLLASKSVQCILWDFDFCITPAGAIACGVIFIFNQMRTFESAGTTLIITNLTIVGVFVLTFLYPDDGDRTEKHFTFFDTVSDFTAIVFAYSGHVLYFDMMKEMENPHDFHKVLWIGYGIIFAYYLLISYMGYYILGDPTTFLIDKISNLYGRIGGNGLMFLNLLGPYILYQQVVCRWLYNKMFTEDVLERSWKARIRWCVLTTFITGLVFVVANAIPFIDIMTEMTSCLLTVGICFTLPAYMHMVEVPESDFGKKTILVIIVLFGLATSVLGLIGVIETWNEYMSTTLPFDCQSVHDVTD